MKRPSNRLRDRIKNLDIEIRNFYFIQNRTKIRKDIRPGNSKSLWNSVKIAKDINVEPIPKKLFLRGSPVDNSNRCDRIAEFFYEKVKGIERTTQIDPTMVCSF